jgi:hypothetical protein
MRPNPNRVWCPSEASAPRREQIKEHVLPPGMAAWQTEHGFEFNVLLRYGPFAIQPVIQYYANAGGIGGDAFAVGFRTKIDF